MNERLEQEFEDIIQRAIHSAEAVKCSMRDFAEGLKNMSISLDERMNLVFDEIADVEDEEEDE